MFYVSLFLFYIIMCIFFFFEIYFLSYVWIKYMERKKKLGKREWESENKCKIKIIEY